MKLKGGIFIVRLLLGLLLLGWVFAGIPFDEFTSILQSSLSRPISWLLALLFMLLGLMAAGLRWHTLLQAQGVAISAPRVLRLFFIGQFFNSFLPGSCGGDVVRVYYVFRETQLKRTEAASTVLVDRGVGLLTIIFFACIIILFRWSLLLADIWTRVASLLMIGLLLGAVGAIALFFHHNLFSEGHVLSRLKRWLPRGGPILERVYGAFYLYRRRPLVLFASVILSLGNLVGLTLSCLFFAQALGLSLGALDVFTFFPIITVLSAIPITPGALGVRENLFVQMFEVIGLRASQALPLSLMVYLGGLFWSLVGGLLYLNYSARYGASIRSEWRKLSEPGEDA